ncbi:MAG: sugar ABC transporter permease [Proteobacteria bacterium]|nr:sugar ABC transporter permease [Pseudomonadota bacterium]
MSGTHQALSDRLVSYSGPRRSVWRMPFKGSDTAWAVAFLVPYIAVFVAFVLYPVAFGLWMGSEPDLYGWLLSDPLYPTIAVNTLLFVAFGVNLQLFGAFLLSGYFMGGGWWRRVLLAIFLLPWAMPALSAFISIHYMVVSQWGFFDSLWLAVTGTDGPFLLLSRWSAMATNILSYIWKWMPFWTLVFLGARMAIPRDVYEAAAVDGARPLDALLHITIPMLANVYLVATLLSTLWTFGDFSTVYFISYGAPARQSDVLATYGVRAAFDFAQPRQGVAAMMTALPLMIPVTILLIRRVRRMGVQL